MCTVLTRRAGGGFFARNLDQHTVYGQQVAVTPRRAPLRFRYAGTVDRHYAMIGAAVMRGGEPLYFEAVNDRGLAAAALAFEGECRYAPSRGEDRELAPFELIPFVLSQCQTVDEVRSLLQTVTLTAIPFSDRDPLTPLHWMVSDRERSLVIEPLEGVCRLFDDPVEVLTNSPRLPYQLQHLASFASLRVEEPSPLFGLPLLHRGHGLRGLPGDFTPSSRFVRAAVLNAAMPDDADAAVLDCFRLLDNAAFLRGAVPSADGAFALTQYSCVCSLADGTYYYKTYGDPTVRALSLRAAPTDGDGYVVYPMTAAFRPLCEN